MVNNHTLDEIKRGLEKYLGGSYAEAYLVGGVGMWKKKIRKKRRRLGVYLSQCFCCFL